MQLVLPWWPKGVRAKRAGRAPSVLQIGPDVYPVAITRHRRARRYVLRMTDEGGLRLTVPRGASIADGLAFAKQQGAWIARERARRETQSGTWEHGRLVWFRGVQVPLIVETACVSFGAETAERSRRRSPNRGASLTGVREAFDAHVRRIASAELPARCRTLAAQHGLTVTRVSIRNQRSRWGSCSTRGTVALNWRLVLMPPGVSDYVILHELMHLRQPNHSRRFWREVAAVCDTWREAERWLKAHGRELF